MQCGHSRMNSLIKVSGIVDPFIILVMNERMNGNLLTGYKDDFPELLFSIILNINSFRGDPNLSFIDI